MAMIPWMQMTTLRSLAPFTFIKIPSYPAKSPPMMRTRVPLAGLISSGLKKSRCSSYVPATAMKCLHISLCDMDKDKIMNYWDQLAHLTFLCHADNIMHGNETGYPLLVQQILHIQFATVSDPHGKPLCFFTTKHTLGALTYVYLSVLQSVTLPFRIIQEVLTSFLWRSAGKLFHDRRYGIYIINWCSISGQLWPSADSRTGWFLCVKSEIVIRI